MKRGDDMQIVAWLRRLAAANRIEREYDDKKDQWIVKRNGYAASIFKPGDAKTRISVPKPGGAKAFEVVGIPLKDAGFYVVELASPKLGAALLGEPKPFHVRAAVMVTNLSVHFKLGRESSLVWVTQLERRDAGGRTRRWPCATAAAPCTGRAAPTRRASRA